MVIKDALFSSMIPPTIVLLSLVESSNWNLNLWEIGFYCILHTGAGKEVVYVLRSLDEVPLEQFKVDERLINSIDYGEGNLPGNNDSHPDFEIVLLFF